MDPGGTTGFALVSYSDGRYWLRDHGGLIGNAEVSVRQLLAVAPDVDAYACERFVVSRRAGRSASAHSGQKARDIIGALVASGHTVHLETAAAAKRWATDKRLAAAGLTPTEGLPHSRDAARHALYALVKHYRCPDPLSVAYQGGPDHG